MSDDLRLSGKHAGLIIRNVARMAARKYRHRPLWALVADMTGHGSTTSTIICASANLNPNQTVTVKPLLCYGVDQL